MKIEGGINYFKASSIQPFALATMLLALLVLSACATKPLPQGKSSEYKRIGILSTMGDRFALRAVGVTVFGNESGTAEIEIGADEFITQQILDALSNKYTVIDLSKYRKAYMAQPKYWPGQKGVFSKDHPMVPDVVKNIMGGEGLDAYVLVSPAVASVGFTNQAVGGIGIATIKKPLRRSEYNLYAAYIVSVFDGKNFSLMADMRAAPLNGPSIFSFSYARSINSPNVTIPYTWAQEPEKHKIFIEGALKDLFRNSIPDTLQRTNLLP